MLAEIRFLQLSLSNLQIQKKHASFLSLKMHVNWCVNKTEVEAQGEIMTSRKIWHFRKIHVSHLQVWRCFALKQQLVSFRAFTIKDAYRQVDCIASFYFENPNWRQIWAGVRRRAARQKVCESERHHREEHCFSQRLGSKVQEKKKKKKENIFSNCC